MKKKAICAHMLCEMTVVYYINQTVQKIGYRTFTA